MMQMPVPSPLMSERRTSALGGALVAIGPISMALYTPALPTLTHVFHTTDAVIKLTLTAYFAGFAFTQLICGPLTDAYGRRPVALWFLALYLGATVLATWAPTIEWLVIARLFQGVGAAVGVSVSRAIVRDQYAGQASSRILNTVSMMLAVGPAVSPTIGGITLALLGWQEIFYFMVLYGIALGAAVLFLLPETNLYRDPARARPKPLVRAYAALLAAPGFMRPALFLGFSLGTIYTMATLIPFVMIDHVGLTPTQFGLGMMFQSACFFCGTILTARLLRHFPAERLLPWSMIGIVVGMSLLAITLHMPTLRYLTVMTPIGIFTFSIAMGVPAATTAAMASFPRIAGSAAALMGFIQFGSGFLGSIIGASFGDPVLAMSIVAPAMPILGILAYLILGFLIRRSSPSGL
ncbi:multidrug effflux MFS transporter [Breoghania sp.]|uniref:multidrug effflux MFS transporter n=1 Tax=Breoghania sp. TaxID=2065378 RepID=UPI002AABFBD9|nr:multidrug effflux MFS transporter [Breoghania sp.]